MLILLESPRAARSTILAGLGKPKTRNELLAPSDPSHTFPSPSFLRQDFDLLAARLYPAGAASASIRRTMPPNSPPSQMALSQKQPVLPRMLHQPAPVFADTCYKLVNDQPSTFFGNASHRHRFAPAARRPLSRKLEVRQNSGSESRTLR